MAKLYYTYEQWKIDKHRIDKWLLNIMNPHLVSLYRGSLWMGAEFSNIQNLPLSIGKFQSYDGDDKEFEMLYNAGIKEDETIVILDDILDTGNTMLKAYEYFEKYFPTNPVVSITIFGKLHSGPLANNLTVRPHDGRWIVFPGEVLQ